MASKVTKKKKAKSAPKKQTPKKIESVIMPGVCLRCDGPASGRVVSDTINDRAIRGTLPKSGLVYDRIVWTMETCSSCNALQMVRTFHAAAG